MKVRETMIVVGSIVEDDDDDWMNIDEGEVTC